MAWNQPGSNKANFGTERKRKTFARLRSSFFELQWIGKAREGVLHGKRELADHGLVEILEHVLSLLCFSGRGNGQAKWYLLKGIVTK